MPNKTVAQREKEWAAKITADINAGIDERFGRLEQTIQRLAAGAPPAIAAEGPATNLGPQKRNLENDEQLAPPAKRVSTDTQQRPGNELSQSTFDHSNAPSASKQHIEQTPLSTRSAAQPARLHPSAGFAEFVPVSDPATFVNNYGRAQKAASASRPDSTPWAAWSTAHQMDVPKARNTSSLHNAAHEALYGDRIESQVQQLLASSVHTLARGKVDVKDFPYKYIQRGPEKVNASINSVSMAEHLWGIFRMLHDHKTDPDIKPCLMLHMEQIVEDGREFEWATGVRRWSEETFSRIAEGRMLNGWHSYDEIKRLRMIISQSKPISTHQPPTQKEQSYKRHTQGSQQGYEMLRGSPPCPAYNSTTGCNLNSGHISNGKRMVHICAFCLHNTSAVNPHPEAQCRNKIRLTGSNASASHFQ